MGQEGDTGGVRPGGRQGEVHDRTQEPIGDLNEDAGAVAGVRVRTERATMFEVAECSDCVFDDAV